MKKFKFFVDGIKFQTEKQFLTGLEIKMMANVPEDLDLYLVVHGYQDELISNDKTVNLSRPGVEKFETRKKHEGLLLIINTRPVAFDGKKISYEEVVSLAGYDLVSRIGDIPSPTKTAQSRILRVVSRRVKMSLLNI